MPRAMQTRENDKNERQLSAFLLFLEKHRLNGYVDKGRSAADGQLSEAFSLSSSPSHRFVGQVTLVSDKTFFRLRSSISRLLPP
jgi:hypothetical protein